MRSIRILMVIVLLVGAVFQSSAVLAGNQPHTRTGLYVGFGVGAGTFDVGSDNADGRTGGLAGNFRIGKATGEKMLIGFRSSGAARSEDGATLSIWAGHAGRDVLSHPREFLSARWGWLCQGIMGRTYCLGGRQVHRHERR